MARFLIVEARFYEHLNDMLIEGASDALAKAGHVVDKLTVPGALELPGAIAAAAESGQYEGFVALGHACSIQMAVSTSTAAIARLNHSSLWPWASHCRSSAPISA